MDLVVQYGVDIALILILIISVISSMHKGFLKSLLSLACFAVALIAASAFNEPVSDWCYENIISDIVVKEVENAMSEGFSSESAAVTVQSSIDMLPGFITEYLKNMGIDISTVSKQIADLELSSADTALRISENIIRPGALVLLRMIFYLIIFIAVRFVLGLLSGVLNGITKLPLLKQVNKWLGAALGLIKGIVLLLAVCSVLNFVGDITKNSDVLSQTIENSRICAMIDESGF